MDIVYTILHMGTKRAGRPEDVGARIRHARKALQLTQEQLAAQCDITQPTLSSIERGDTKNPEADTILKLAVALRCTPYYLLWDHEQPANMAPNQAFMMDLWQDMTDHQRGQVIGYAQAMLEREREQKPARKAAEQPVRQARELPPSRRRGSH